MKIAIIGPSHPYKGGIAQHTTELAHQLAALGHEVQLISWKAQYPFFYPGVQFVADDKPELPVFPGAKRVLSWKNPGGWWRQARRLRNVDQVIFVWWVPTVQGPVYLTMLRALGRRKPVVTIICHNVLPHEGRFGDRWLAKAVLGKADRVIVHAPAEVGIAKNLGATEVHLANLLAPVLATPPNRHKKPGGLTHHLLFFGIVRPYKGVDVLLKAMAQLPDIHLTVAGEFWQQNAYDKLLAELDLTGRVELRKGYVPAEELPQLFAAADALVLPYRGGTASYHVQLAHAHGLPVIATTAATLATQVRDGVDGLLCQPDDVGSLVAAIRHFYKPGVAQKLRQGIPEISTDADWQAYARAII